VSAIKPIDRRPLSPRQVARIKKAAERDIVDEAYREEWETTPWNALRLVATIESRPWPDAVRLEEATRLLRRWVQIRVPEDLRPDLRAETAAFLRADSTEYRSTDQDG
jgi:hypothetical protein